MSHPLAAGRVAATTDRLWVAPAHEAAVVALDWPSLRLRSVVALSKAPRAEYGLPAPVAVTHLVAGDRFVWVSCPSAGGVVCIDALTAKIVGIATCAPGALAANGDGAWVACTDDRLLRLDVVGGELRTRDLVRTGVRSRDVADAFGALWVAGDADGEVCRVDRDTGEVVARIEVAGRGRVAPPGTRADAIPGLLAVDDSLWVGAVSWPDRAGRGPWSGEVELVRIDPAANRVEDRVPLPHVPVVVAAGDDELCLCLYPSTTADPGRLAVGLEWRDGTTGRPWRSLGWDGLPATHVAHVHGRWMVVHGHRIGVVSEDGARLEARDLPEVDLRDHAPEYPATEPPPNRRDADAYERWFQAWLEAATVGSAEQRVPAVPALVPLAAGSAIGPTRVCLTITGPRDVYEEVRLRGDHPDTVAEVIFTSRLAPGVRFGWRWAIWNEEPYEALVCLGEDTATLAHRPPPDDEGIVWIAG